MSELEEIGFQHWLDRQLAPEPEPGLERATAEIRRGFPDPYLLLERFQKDEVDEATRELERALASDPEAARAWYREMLRNLHQKELRRAHDQSELTWHILSEYQLREVMVDFWRNHFNVFASKGAAKIFVPDFIESVIRPRALGRFEDLLVATAQHPAMLIYLDQFRSRKNSQRGGLNENYARELLELHTLGVDGGYTQTDVVEAARILTGYTLSPPGPEPPHFVFRRRSHDRGRKTVLGQKFGPTARGASGEREPLELLSFLAAHRSTAHHLGTKLCVRFVNEIPPPGCIRDAERAFLQSGGDLVVVLRAIFSGEDFWAADNRGGQFKTPLEFLVSAARALELPPQRNTILARRLSELGEPLLLYRAPTGYPVGTKAWSAPGQLLQRVRYAWRLAEDRHPGLEITWSSQKAEDGLDSEELVRLSERVFAGRVPEDLWNRVDGLVGFEHGPRLGEGEAIALLVASPEFQLK